MTCRGKFADFSIKQHRFTVENSKSKVCKPEFLPGQRSEISRIASEAFSDKVSRRWE